MSGGCFCKCTFLFKETKTKHIGLSMCIGCTKTHRTKNTCHKRGVIILNGPRKLSFLNQLCHHVQTKYICLTFFQPGTLFLQSCSHGSFSVDGGFNS